MVTASALAARQLGELDQEVDVRALSGRYLRAVAAPDVVESQRRAAPRTA